MTIDGEPTSVDGKKGGAHREAEMGSHFLQGDFVIFKAENQLFRVPVYQFISGSIFFQTLLPLPVGNEEVPGRRESNPVVLPPPISAEDFGNFMKVLYPQGTCSWFTLPKAVWISTLKLSSLWYFIHFRDVAIQRLSEKNNIWVVSPPERVALAREYKVPQWLLQGLQELADKRVLVSHSDAKIIGFEAAFRLAHICVGSGSEKSPSSKRPSSNNVSYRDWIDPRVEVAAVFDQEFQELTEEASMYALNLKQD